MPTSFKELYYHFIKQPMFGLMLPSMKRTYILSSDLTKLKTYNTNSFLFKRPVRRNNDIYLVLITPLPYKLKLNVAS